MIQFDWTISFGVVVEIVSFVGTIIAGAFWLGRKLSRMDMKINIMWSWWTRRMKLDDTDEEIQKFFESSAGRRGAGL